MNQTVQIPIQYLGNISNQMGPTAQYTRNEELFALRKQFAILEAHREEEARRKAVALAEAKEIIELRKKIKAMGEKPVR